MDLSLVVWKFGNLEVWKFGSLEVWKFGSLEVWDLEFESECGIVSWGLRFRAQG